MDTNSILEALVQALRDKRSVLKKEIISLNIQEAELTAHQQQIADQLRHKILERESFTEAAVNKFVDRWKHRSPHAPIPCPLCFALGKESHVIPLSGNDEIEPLKCKVCGETFEVPVA